jgi:hypothetical protein
MRPPSTRAPSVLYLDDFDVDPAEQSAERAAHHRALALAAAAGEVQAGHAGAEGQRLISPHHAALDAAPLKPYPRPGGHAGASAALDLEAWSRDGFCVLGRVVTDAELGELSEAAFALIEAAFAASGMSDRAQWAARVAQVPEPADWEPRLGALERNPALLSAAAAALGAPAARCAWAHLVFKPPGEPRPLPWHADRPTWPLPAGVEGVAAWLSLDALRTTSGGLRYAPGSHRANAPLQDPVTPQVSAGEAILHNADVLHASGPNNSGAWRRAWIGVFVDASAPTR